MSNSLQTATKTDSDQDIKPSGPPKPSATSGPNSKPNTANVIPSTPSEAGDYTLLWATVNTCVDQANARSSSLKALAGTLAQAAQLEEHHAQSLGVFRKKNALTQHKPNSPVRNISQTSTLENGLISFGCVFVDNLIKSRVVVAHEYATLGKKLSSFRDEQKKAQKQLINENSRLDKQLQTQLSIYQRSQQKYHKSCREAEKLIEQRDRTDLQRNPNEILKLQTKTGDQIDASIEAERIHKQVVEETHRVQDRNRTAKEKLAKEFQHLERARAFRIRTVLARVAQVHLEQAEYLRSLLEDLEDTAKNIDPDQDSAEFVQVLTKGVAPEINYEQFIRYQSDALDRNVRERSASGGLFPHRESMRSTLPPPASVMDENLAQEPLASLCANVTHEPASTSQNPANQPTEPVAIPEEPILDPDSLGVRAVSLIPQQDLKLLSEQTKLMTIEVANVDESDLVKAAFVFEPIQDDMISLDIGDIVRVIHKDPCGWWTGEKLDTGARGLFPGNYVKPLCSDPEPSLTLAA